MHEMSLCESMLQLMEEQAKSQSFSRVKSVWLEIGQLSGVEIDALRFGFEVVMRNSLAEGAELHPLQRKFLEHAALQCGICTPGFLVAAKSLLERNPDPTETQVRYWLAGNLCRCTGYDKIVRAVLDAAEEMRGAA